LKYSEIPEIRSLPLFRDMEDANFDALVRGGYVQNFAPQIELITEGESSDFLHIVLEGAVELFAAWNGRDTTMATVRPLGTFILAATIRDAPYLMSARTATKSRVILLPSEDVRAIFHSDNGFARSVVNELAQCYRSVVKDTKNLKLRTSIERLANYLLRKQGYTGRRGEFRSRHRETPACLVPGDDAGKPVPRDPGAAALRGDDRGRHRPHHQSTGPGEARQADAADRRSRQLIGRGSV